MEQKVFLFTSIPLVAVILIFGYLNIQQEPLDSSNQNKDICKQIEYNGNDRIDILFISSEEDARHYSDYLFTVEPYKTYRDYFNVRVLEEEAKCEYYKDIAILCYEEGVELAKQCDNDYVIVVKEDSKQIRSSAYGKVISLNKAHEDSVLIHEFGHLFNLAEEYGGAKIPKGSQNCKSSCANFELDVDGCTQECSESSYYRSIPVGVMRSLITDNYGVYDIALISQILAKNKPKETTITGNQISEDIICKDKLISVEVNGNNVLTDNIISEGCTPNKGLAGPLCIGDVCNINTLFTDSQDITTDETLKGETYVDANIPITFFIKPNEAQPIVNVILDGTIIGTINTAEAGATACVI